MVVSSYSRDYYSLLFAAFGLCRRDFFFSRLKDKSPHLEGEGGACVVKRERDWKI